MLQPNLLPWREAQQQMAQQRFKQQILFMLLVGLVIIGSWRIFLGYEENHLKNTHTKLLNFAQQLEPQVAVIRELKKEQLTLIAAFKNEQKIIAQQTNGLQLLHDLSAIPPTVILTQVQKNNDVITLQGRNNFPSAGNQLAQKLASLPYVLAPQLTNG